MPIGLAVTLCALGGGFLIPALILRFLKRKYEKNCTENATAVVIGVRVRSSGDISTMHPEYEYSVDGKRYTNIGSYRQWHVPKKGTEVQIRYNPDRPQQSYIVNYDLISYKRLGVVFGIFGLIPIAICAVVAIYTLL